MMFHYFYTKLLLEKNTQKNIFGTTYQEFIKRGHRLSCNIDRVGQHSETAWVGNDDLAQCNGS